MVVSRGNGDSDRENGNFLILHSHGSQANATRYDVPGKECGHGFAVASVQSYSNGTSSSWVARRIVNTYVARKKVSLITPFNKQCRQHISMIEFFKQENNHDHEH